MPETQNKFVTTLAICHFVVALLLVILLLGLHNRPEFGVGMSKTYVRADRAVEKAIAESVPGSFVLLPIHAIVQLILPLLLLTTGVALFFGKGWGRTLTLVYAVVSLLDALWYGGSLYAVTWSNGEALQAAMAAEHLGSERIAEVVRVQTPAIVVGVLYPIFVLLGLAKIGRPRIADLP